MNAAPMNICVEVFAWMNIFTSLGYIFRNGISGINDDKNLLMNCRIIFQSDCTILHFYKQHLKIPISPLYPNTFRLFDYSRSM